MNPPNQQSSNGPSAFLIIGILVAVVVIALMLMDHPSQDSANTNVVHLTTANWQREVIDSSVPVVVDFWAPWCGPCRQLAPTIDKLATTYAGRVKVGKLNVDDANEIAAKYNVNGIPHVLIFKGGKLAASPRPGLLPERELTRFIDGVLQ